MKTRAVAWTGAFLISLSGQAAALCSSDPYAGDAAHDSPIVRTLLATPVPAAIRDIGYIADALELLGQESAATFNAYLERAEWLETLGEPPLQAATVGEAIRRERGAEPLAGVRERVFVKVLSVRLATAEDPLPDRVDTRLRQVSPSVWDWTEEGPYTSRYLRVVLANEGRKDFAGFKFSAVVTHPPLEVHCELPFELAAGQQRSLFCGTVWSKKVPLRDVVGAAQAVQQGRATLTLKPQAVLLRGARFNLQFDGTSYLRTAWPNTCADYRAAALVRESNCLARGSCFRTLVQVMGEFGLMIGIAFALGAIFGTPAGGLSAPPALMWIITGIAAILPFAVFGALTAAGSLAALMVPTMGAYVWVAFMAGLWGSWLLARLFRRRAA